MTTAVAAPFRFFSLQVARTRRLGPSLVRVTFRGADLAHFHSHGRDQSLSLFLPAEGCAEPAVLQPVEGHRVRVGGLGSGRGLRLLRAQRPA
ncbi:siderophore-interacting protein, partial [Streptomyces sp. NPDC007162]|uniref:siderophore-interacting protein n=1 Tax=Streptomyces sp. NPDC007162 TaxID=3156917 RepID=UPI0033F12BF4